MAAGRDINNLAGNFTFNISRGASDGNGGRVNAVTTSVEKNPLGDNFWTVKVSNGTKGPITGLVVDVYVVDDQGNRSAARCVPAKQRISLSQVVEKMVGPALSGGLSAFGAHAQQMYAGYPGLQGISVGGLSNLGAFGPMMASQVVNSPQLAGTLKQVQAGMLDKFPSVLTAETSSEVVYLAEGEGEVQADIAFDDEDNGRWFRPFGKPPKPLQ